METFPMTFSKSPEDQYHRTYTVQVGVYATITELKYLKHA